MLHAIAALAIAASPWPQDPTALIDNLLRLQDEYKRCLIERTVALGASNSEGAETILRAVSAECLPKETELRAAYAETPFPQTHVEGLMRRDKKAGEDAGVAALLRVRAERAAGN